MSSPAGRPRRSCTAAEALTHIAARYRIEREIGGFPAEARHQVREERSRPLLTAIEHFPQGKLALLGQKSTLAVAIRYATPRGGGLKLSIEDAAVPRRSASP